MASLSQNQSPQLVRNLSIGAIHPMPILQKGNRFESPHRTHQTYLPICQFGVVQVEYWLSKKITSNAILDKSRLWATSDICCI